MLPDRRHLCAGGILCLLLAACDSFPRDPEGTWERITREGIRIGVIDDQPEISRDSLPQHITPTGEELDLVLRMLRDLDVEVAEWQTGPGDHLLERLERFELDLVIGGLTTRSPWKARVGFSRPWKTDFVESRRHVLALPPGENRWIMIVDRWISQQKEATES